MLLRAMATQTLISRQYPGLVVCFTCDYEPQRVSYTHWGDFNGGTPESLDITIEDVLVGQVSIHEWIQNSILERLEEEIAEHIHWS
jgi:hypothetical protein